MSRLAVIIPAFNAARFLAVALEGAMAQTVAPDEIVVVDDGSTDGTAEIARRYPVRLIRHSENRGPSAARNTGIAHSNSKYVAFLDADDYWSPHHCGLLTGLLDRDDRSVLACARCTFLGGETITPPLCLPDGQPAEAVWTLMHSNPVVQSAAVVRREAVLAAGGYDESMRYAEDYDLWLRLARRGPFVGLDRVTCVRRVHPDQLSHNATTRIALGAWQARAAAAEHLRENGTPEEQARVDAALLGAWLAELEMAVASRTPEALAAVRAVRPLVPGAEQHARRWLVQRYLIWPLRRSAQWVGDRFPQVAALARRVRRRTRQ